MRAHARTIGHRIASRLVAGALHAHRDEEGGSLVFGALTLFTLVLFTYLVYVVGMASGERLQLQGAADAAAYSGALVEAESIESIGFLNDGMAFVYYAACRYAIDAAVYGTLGCFYYHDYYQYQQGKIPPDVQDGPWQNMEMDVQAINPGARPASDTQNPNYIPPAPDGFSQQTIDYGWALLGDDGGSNLFKNRFDQAVMHASNLLGGQQPLAKLWLQDIHYAERLIIAATPALIEKTAVQVAQQNGAVWVGVSRDMDKLWRIHDGNDPDSNLAGFEDGHERGNGVSATLANRYAKMPNPVDGKVQDYPDWFDATTGQSRTPYSQTRICWNKRDWQHEHDPATIYDHTGISDPQYSQFSSTPAGHWHARHAHNVDQQDPQSGDWVLIGPAMGADGNHDFGHGIQSGDDQGNHTELTQGTPMPPDMKIDDGDVNAEPAADHHQAQLCPTCLANPDQPTPNGVTYPCVTHDQNDAEWLFQQMGSQSNGNGNGNGGGSTDTSQWDKVTFDSGNGVGSNKIEVPRLVMARAQLFRGGVTVVCWAPGGGVGSVFPANSFGMLAIASAQVGVRTPDPQNRTTGTISVADSITNQTVTFSTGHSDFDLRETASGSTQPMNLYLGEGDTTNPGARWGARLVPIARELTWIDDGSGDPAGSGLKNLLAPGGRWFRAPGQELQQSERGQLAQMLQNLSGTYDPSKNGAVQALVH